MLSAYLVFLLLIGSRCSETNKITPEKGPLFKSHPMLFYSQDHMEYLQKSAWSTHTNITKVLKRGRDIIMKEQKKYFPPETYEEFGARWNEYYGNNLPPLALYYVLHPTDIKLRDFLFIYMDRMANLHKWQVIPAPNDEVPVGHSLAGFATAVDMMYRYLDSKRRTKYISKIVNVTREMYDLSKKRWWGKNYLQNHVATNFVALFIGALVSEPHFTTSTKWKLHALHNFEKTVKLLKYISDGSLDEGVPYVGYTFRSISMYIFLVKRHCIIDHTKNPWLVKHFAFNYYTVLPGFRQTVGIADSSLNWYYGPESQLTFLETFVLQNGSAIWLANKIREMSDDMRSNSSVGITFTTVHTEYIWYNPNIKPIPPKSYGREELHHFQDWGVVTYRTAHAQTRQSSFCSFKSSYIHGKAVYHFANGLDPERTPKFIHGWNFNPGHEHPDQNSFTFVPHGHHFVSEGYYSKKLSYLNNILVFGPSETDTCSPPFVGQLGDCDKWLKWKTEEQSHSHGKILFHGVQDGIMYVSGEAVKAYPSNLRLRSVERTLIMLDEDLLVVVDFVEKHTKSKVKRVSAHFNNVFHNFTHSQSSKGLNGAQISPSEGVKLNCLWLSASGDNPKANIQYIDYKQAKEPNKASNLNITFPFETKKETFVYVFSGPISQTTSLNIIGDHSNETLISVKTDDQRFLILRTYKNKKHNFAVHNAQTGIITIFPNNISHATHFSDNIENISDNSIFNNKATVKLFLSLGLVIGILRILAVKSRHPFCPKKSVFIIVTIFLLYIVFF